jgi:hypothetical protein
MKTKIFLLSAFMLIVALALTSTASAAIPHLMNFQGKATDKTGVPLNGAYNLTFRIYDSETGGTLKWSETQTNIQVSNGIFQVQLGSVTPLNLPFDGAYWISLEINTDGEMSPRTRLASVPYAYKAESLMDASPRVLMWYLPHDVEVGTNKSAYLVVPFSGEIVKATAYAKTSPVGAMTLKIDINKNGTTIWGNQDNRLQFASGANTATSSTFTTTSVAENDYFTLDIDSIGSTLPGTDITVMLQIKETK